MANVKKHSASPNAESNKSEVESPVVQTTAQQPLGDGILKRIPIGSIHQSPLNPRKHYDKDEIDGLAATVRTEGVVQHITVRPIGDVYHVVMGSRRRLAAIAAGLTELTCIVKEMDDARALAYMLIENDQRKDPDEIEQGAGYKLLMKISGKSAQEIADEIGMKKATVYLRMKIGETIPAAQAAYREKKIAAGHLERIARLPMPADQETALHYAIENEASVKDLANFVAENLYRELSAAPWLRQMLGGPGVDRDTSSLHASAITCRECKKHDKETCFDSTCFDGKSETFITIQTSVLRDQYKTPLLVTNDWTYGRDEAHGAIGREKWLPVDRKKPCPKARQAVFIEAENRSADRELSASALEEGIESLRSGDIILVCADPKCPTHNRASGGSGSRGPVTPERKKEVAKAREKRTTLEELRTRVLERVPPMPNSPMMRIIAEGVWRRTEHMRKMEICKRHKWNKDQMASYSGTSFARWLKEQSDVDVMRFMVEVIAADESTLLQVEENLDAPKSRANAGRLIHGKPSKEFIDALKPGPGMFGRGVDPKPMYESAHNIAVGTPGTVKRKRKSAAFKQVLSAAGRRRLALQTAAKPKSAKKGGR